MRILIDYVLPLLLPTLLWLLWLAWRRRRAEALGQTGPGWDSVPWTWLLAAGALLAALILVGGTLEHGYSKGHYLPAHVDQNGKVLPGRIE